MSSVPPQANRMLASLAEAECECLSSHLQPVTLTGRQLLYAPDVPIQDIYFPTTALISERIVCQGGRLLESANIGREGIAGIQAFLGDRVPRQRFLVQVTGEGYRMPLATFAHLLNTGVLKERVFRYIGTLMEQRAQLIACNILHSIEQRICRWLAIVHDRTGRDELPVTHQDLAEVLGVRRASISEIASLLQKAGVLSLRRSMIAILDIKGVETGACECYGMMKGGQQNVSIDTSDTFGSNSVVGGET